MKGNKKTLPKKKFRAAAPKPAAVIKPTPEVREQPTPKPQLPIPPAFDPTQPLPPVPPESLTAAEPPSDTPPSSSQDNFSPNDKRNKNLFILGCFSLLVIIIISAGIPWFLSQYASQQEVILPSPTPIEKAEMKKEIVTKTLNKSDFTFEVLNGSGTAGVAGKTAEKIRALGFDVVIIGNADKSTYATSPVFIKNSLTDKQDLLLEELKKAIPSATYTGELTDSTASARLIVGKE